MLSRRKNGEEDRQTIRQDGFSAMVEGIVCRSWHEDPVPMNPAPAEVPKATGYIPPHISELELKENEDGSCTVVRCLNTGAVYLDIAVSTGRNNVTAIAPHAFEGLISLKDVVLPESLRIIGERAFADCKGLEKIVIPGAVQKIGALAFARCRNLQSVHLEPGVMQLGPSCFSKCPALRRIDIPSSVTSFGGGVFIGCRDVVVCGGTDTTAGQYAAQNGLTFDPECWKKDDALILQEEEDGSLAVAGCRDSGASSIEIPAEIGGKQVSSILPRAFYGMAALTAFHCRARIAEIGEKAFFGCGALKELSFDYGVERIGDSAFALCTSIENVVLPKGTQQIGRMAFFACAKLAFVKLPPVTKVYDLAFDGCSKEIRIFGGVSVGKNT